MQYDINWFRSRVNVTPDEIAVIDAKTNEAWTYAQLFQRSEKLADYFLAHGIQKGDRIALLAPNHISYFDFLFASMKIGAIFVPLNWRLAKDEMNYVLHDCDPKIIGVDPSFRDNAKSAENSSELILIDTNDYIERLRSEHFAANIIILESDPLAMIYTGGTTGRPKGVVLSHRSILWNALNTVVSWNLSNEDTTLTCLPMFHTGGLNVYSLPLLLVGGKVVIDCEFNAEKAVEDLLKFKCTVVLFVPTMYHSIIRTSIFKESNFPDMKVFVSGGAPCPHKIYEAFSKKGIAFKEGYGLTEAGPNNFFIHPEDTFAKLGSVGKPMIFNDIKIIRNNQSEVEPGEVGELVIRGNHSFEYYWKKPVQTKETIVDGWIHTGDLARQDKDGFVFIVGRKKDMIITGGENVYPLEVENWLETHDHIEEAAVIGLPDDKWGEMVAAFVVSKGKLTEAELALFCKERLTRYKVPKQFYFLNELPKTDVGKINKTKLKETVIDNTNSTIS